MHVCTLRVRIVIWHRGLTCGISVWAVVCTAQLIRGHLAAALNGRLYKRLRHTPRVHPPGAMVRLEVGVRVCEKRQEEGGSTSSLVPRLFAL